MLAQRATSVRPVVAAKPAARRIRVGSRQRCKATNDAATTVVPAGALQLAHRLADVAGEITSQYFRTGLMVMNKDDASPVTVADRAAEAAMRDVIGAAFPSHGVYGEEAGMQGGGDGEWVWVLDPIDGTKSFITGKPLFGTLIALLHDGVPVLGVIDQPILKERWVGVAGQVTTLNDKPIATRPCEALADAYMYSTTPLMFEGANLTAYNRLADRVKIPMYGCDCYAYGLLAAGHCDLVVEADLKPYDFMALVPVVRGAGGMLTDWMGAEVRLDPATLGDGSSVEATEIVAAGDAATHAAALAVLQAR